ncbi:nucleotidyltransferase domain-containing protein [Chelativorans sp. EGI FJ00035]|uniref:Nucleotidyltransferase domain-containing protein n=1 Tax=Chelativorans salis TaxID=2978478 RepID=A0ABT2LTT6_9HYPH|nr:nucleotidyltransferase domain-containing protein [Chelativorans sp. EGI FJ00035]MCT7377950.1 nucleotidyltransferase domain-containing protein [Chelativorans sp. EGI FJ00035]
MVEFLTPAFGDEKVKPLPALGVSAQALNYLNFLIADPLRAVALYRSGVLVQVPRPERFAIHKLIVADRRYGGPDQLKARKDRARPSWRFFPRTVQTSSRKPTRTRYRVVLAGVPGSRQV